MELYTVHVSCHITTYIKRHKKKYRSLETDLETLKTVLKINRENAIFLKPYNADWEIYKTRLLCKSLNKGKSGGFRVIYIKNKEKKQKIMFFIYYKGDKENMPIKEIIQQIDGIPNL